MKLFETEQVEGREPAADVSARRPRIGVRRTLPMDVGELHLLVEELQDERSSLRWREAMWISIIVHLVIFILLAFSPRWFPGLFGPKVMLARALDHEPTFLTLPPDAQKYMSKPKTNVLSDKNRVATSRDPNEYRPTPQEIERMRRQGRPGQSAQQPRPQAQQAPPQQTAQAQQPQQQAPQQQQRQEPPQEAKLREPESQPQAPRPNPFGSGESAGSAIQDALRAAVNGRGSGSGGEYGIGVQKHAGLKDQYDILSDTQGVDFGPYMARVVNAVRFNWYRIIPEEAGPPFYKTGVVMIEFSIRRNGSVGPVVVRSGSGTQSLDHAAYGGITASNPFNPLPSEYKGDDLKLRFYFHYLGPINRQQ